MFTLYTLYICYKTGYNQKYLFVFSVLFAKSENILFITPSSTPSPP